MTWELFLFVSVFSSAISTILQKMLLKGVKDPMGFAIFFQLCTALFIGIFAVFQGFAIPNMQPFWLNFVASIVIYTLANICIFQALTRIEASEFTILFITRGIWTILTATFFLHEHLALIQVFGTVLILGSVALVTYQRKNFHFNKGTLYALCAGFLFGIGYVNDAYIVRFFHSPLTYSFLDFLFPGLVLFLLYRSSVIRTASHMLKPKKIGILVILSLIYSIFGITVLLAYKVGGKASIIGAVSQTATILTILLAIVFLNERKYVAKKIIGSVVAVLGVILVG